MAAMAALHDPGWIRLPVVALAGVDAAWMIVDGIRALVAPPEVPGRNVVGRAPLTRFHRHDRSIS
jgi:hypothetical protein